MRQAGESARTSLKVLETLTYSCTEPKDLWELHASIEELVTEFRAKLPKQDSLVLRPQARNTARKRAKAITHKYRALPRESGEVVFGMTGDTGTELVKKLIL